MMLIDYFLLRSALGVLDLVRLLSSSSSGPFSPYVILYVMFESTMMSVLLLSSVKLALPTLRAMSFSERRISSLPADFSPESYEDKTVQGVVNEVLSDQLPDGVCGWNKT